MFRRSIRWTTFLPTWTTTWCVQLALRLGRSLVSLSVRLPVLFAPHPTTCALDPSASFLPPPVGVCVSFLRSFVWGGFDPFSTCLLFFVRHRVCFVVDHSRCLRWFVLLSVRHFHRYQSWRVRFQVAWIGSCSHRSTSSFSLRSISPIATDGCWSSPSTHVWSTRAPPSSPCHTCHTKSKSLSLLPPLRGHGSFFSPIRWMKDRPSPHPGRDEHREGSRQGEAEDRAMERDAPWEIDGGGGHVHAGTRRVARGRKRGCSRRGRARSPSSRLETKEPRRLHAPRRGTQPPRHVVDECVPTLQIHTTAQNRSIPTRRTVRHEGNPDEDERMANGTRGRRQPKERDRTDGDVTKRTRGSRRRAFPRETPDHAETCLHRPRGQTRKDTQRSFLHPPTEPRRITLATPRVVR